MASLNKCFFIGNLTRDPEVKYMTSGETVTNVSIACNEQWKNKAGEKQESVEFVNLVFYKKLAEIAGKYCRKGASIHVEGKMKTRKWQTKEGQDRYSTEIIVDQMQMLGGKREASEPAQDQHSETKSNGYAPKDAPAAGGSFSDFDSDLPFIYTGSCGLWRSM